MPAWVCVCMCVYFLFMRVFFFHVNAYYILVIQSWTESIDKDKFEVHSRRCKLVFVGRRRSK